MPWISAEQLPQNISYIILSNIATIGMNASAAARINSKFNGE